MNILVLGGGGREHAISWALAKSPRCTELYVAPGNGGTANIARNVKDLNAEDAQAVLAFAQAHNIELVVIGPEAPLVLVLPMFFAKRAFLCSALMRKALSWKVPRPIPSASWMQTVFLRHATRASPTLLLLVHTAKS